MIEHEYFTPEEIAEKLRVDQDTVLRWLKRHELAGYKVGRQWRVSKEDYEKFLAERYNIDSTENE
jgi:excisionase family DNA binding protein